MDDIVIAGCELEKVDATLEADQQRIFELERLVNKMIDAVKAQKSRIVSLENEVQRLMGGLEETAARLEVLLNGAVKKS